MHRPNKPQHVERSIRYHVSSALLSRLVSEAGLGSRLRISPPFPPTLAEPPRRFSLGAKSARAHVRAARSAKHVPGCVVCSGASRALESDRFSIESDRHFTRRLQRARRSSGGRARRDAVLVGNNDELPPAAR